MSIIEFLLCRQTCADIHELVTHFRVIHPALVDADFEVWPDGEPVIHDTTLEPGDFA